MGRDIEITFEFGNIVFAYILSFVIDIPFIAYHTSQIKKLLQNTDKYVVIQTLNNKFEKWKRDVVFGYIFVLLSMVFLLINVNVISVVLSVIIAPFTILFLIPWTIFVIGIRCFYAGMQ